MTEGQDACSGLSAAGSFGLAALHIDSVSGVIDGPGGREQVDPKVMAVLVALAERPGELVTRQRLLDQVWPGRIVGDETLTQCVYQLRRHLALAGGDSGYRELVATLPKRGYRLDGTPSAGQPGSRAIHARGRAWRRAAVYFAACALLLSLGVGAYLFFDRLDPGGKSQSPAANTIAVLPFSDLSPQGDQAYFADGIVEELLDALTRIPGLRVTARTSSFAFKGTNPDIRTVAEKLEVAYVLEGSVRKSGDRVRITTQLVDPESNTHLWSKTYERDLDDIFAIQAEIAHSVAQALHLNLSEPTVSALEPPYDAQAHEHLLLGRFFWRRRGPGDVERSERHYLRAVEIDPRWARPWVGLAGIYWGQAFKPRAAEEALTKMGEALSRALAIDPELPEAHARAFAYYKEVGNQELAEEHWRKARKLGGNSLLVMNYSAFGTLERGDYEHAIELQRRVLSRNPLSAIDHGNHGGLLMAAGRYREAVEAFDRADELNASLKPEHDVKRALMRALEGRHEEAIARAAEWPDSPERDQVLAMAYYGLGRDAAAEAAMDRLRARPGGESALRLAEVEAARGRVDAAFEWLARIGQRTTEAESRTVWPPWQTKARLSPCLRPLRADARWASMIASLPARATIELPGDAVLAADRR